MVMLANTRKADKFKWAGKNTLIDIYLTQRLSIAEPCTLEHVFCMVLKFTKVSHNVKSEAFMFNCVILHVLLTHKGKDVYFSK